VSPEAGRPASCEKIAGLPSEKRKFFGECVFFGKFPVRVAGLAPRTLIPNSEVEICNPWFIYPRVLSNFGVRAHFSGILAAVAFVTRL
jgi:hypothetical protein